MDLSAALLGYSAQSQNQSQDWWNSQSSCSDYSMSSPEAVSPPGCEFSSLCSPCGSVPGLQCARFGGSCTPVSPSPYPVGPVRRKRAKNPSKQRRSASEKEKLRMRDLTKALHRLRTYLPPSLAPAGQSLTKIQILRLAICHIGRLSAQLEPTEGAPFGGTDTSGAVPQNSPEIQGRFHCASVSEFWGSIPSQGHGPHIERWEAPLDIQHPLQTTGLECSWLSSALELSPQDSPFSPSPDSFLQSRKCTETAQSYQICSKDCHQMIPEDFWI